MKKIFRKNQLVITALALMIAVAGYFSYMNNNMEDGQVTAEASADAGTVQDTYDISEEDMLAEIHWLQKIFLRMREPGRNWRLWKERRRQQWMPRSPGMWHR